MKTTDSLRHWAQRLWSPHGAAKSAALMWNFLPLPQSLIGIHQFVCELLFVFSIIQMTWRRNTTESQSAWSSLWFRPSASSTASTTPSCTPSWTRTSRRAASPPSPSASGSTTSRAAPWWLRNSAWSSSNPKAERRSRTRTRDTARTSTPRTKAPRIHSTETAPWRRSEKRSPPSKRSCLQTAPPRSNEEDVAPKAVELHHPLRCRSPAHDSLSIRDCSVIILVRKHRSKKEIKEFWGGVHMLWKGPWQQWGAVVTHWHTRGNCVVNSYQWIRRSFLQILETSVSLGEHLILWRREPCSLLFQICKTFFFCFRANSLEMMKKKHSLGLSSKGENLDETSECFAAKFAFVQIVDFCLCDAFPQTLWVLYTMNHVLSTSLSPIQPVHKLTAQPEDTWTCRAEEPGIEPPTYRLIDNLLYHLTQSRPKFKSDIQHHRVGHVGLCGNAGVLPDHCSEEGAEPQGKAFSLPLDPRSKPSPMVTSSGRWTNFNEISLKDRGVRSLQIQWEFDIKPPEEGGSVARDRDVWDTLLGRLPPQREPR